jgi:UDP-N-acetylmuramoylalanine--D-glutamate ligase
MKLDELKNKKILILGFGREGKDTLSFLKKLFPGKKIDIADQKFDKNYLKKLKDYDLIIKSPGIPFKILPKHSLEKISTQTEIFFNNCPGQIVGITGTKGKSTTASMVYKILKEGGVKAHLIGNIGKPVLSSLLKAKSNDVFVYELSSHQLYNLKKSPHIAVLLNIYPEHLDYYRNFIEYAKAKANITFHQTKNDFFVFNSGDKLIREFAKKTKAKKIPIKGKYYSLNKAAARAVGKIFRIPDKIISKTLKEFKYLAHRLELVGTFKGITFYNDALATIPEATMAAMEVLGNKVETIMLGGFERNIKFKELARKILKSKIKTVILFPTTGEKIWKALRQVQGKKLPKHFFVDNMRDAVALAYQNTSKGKICLLSTASSSFSIFKDYKEKGNLFKKYVKRLARQKKH